MFGENMRDIDIDYVDGIMIVDNAGKIVYSVRYNPRFEEDSKEKEYNNNIINKNFLEVYPSILTEKSTIVECLKKGVTVYKKRQAFYDYTGRLIQSRNLTLPIIKRGKVLGAIEITKDITSIQDLSEEYDQFQKIKLHSVGNLNKENNKTLQFSFEDIITKNDEMIESIEKAKMMADSPSSILVYGETGTGKELFVQAIHNYSNRRNKPFIAQNCAALPENLFESILFGSVKGAFTGAVNKKGLFEEADGGTLFLDEINSMPMNLQAKLLRVLQNGVVRRIGSNEERKVDVRVIAAMNIDPKEAIKNQYIRKDIFYRLSVMSIRLTPLRDRKEDVDLLVNYFIKRYNVLLKKSIQGVSKEAMDLFYKYDWPGNVRELQHIIEGAMNIGKEEKIEIKHLPIYLSDNNENTNFYEETEEIQPLNDVMEMVEKKMIKKAIKKAEGNVSKAAKLLNIPRQTLQYRVSKYNIKID
ncbi:sigma 54-interacting transcriptional regulator [Wukongibacter baidiensis]|uniref:sigma-54 interaction domain-containing protein n=1 Tax=Wukongibacter baidiensis TaxID=1723361 RepID=UPI003D7F36DB